MAAYIFSGREFAKQKEDELKVKVSKLKEKGFIPKLAVILVGDDPSSKIYVKLKQQSAERMGIVLNIIHLDESSKQQLVQLIESLNYDKTIHGIMVQLPLPKGLNSPKATAKMLSKIDPKKDIDGETIKSLYISATLKAIMYSIESAQDHGFINSKMTVCVVGATGIVGSAVVKELRKKCEKIIECNSKTKNLKAETLKADLIITATGVPGIIKKDMIKPGVAIIDVGSPKAEIEIEVREIASFVTPVPGGIGPMTVVCLIENVISSLEKRRK